MLCRNPRITVNLLPEHPSGSTSVPSVFCALVWRSPSCRADSCGQSGCRPPTLITDLYPAECSSVSLTLMYTLLGLKLWVSPSSAVVYVRSWLVWHSCVEFYQHGSQKFLGLFHFLGSTLCSTYTQDRKKKNQNVLWKEPWKISFLAPAMLCPGGVTFRNLSFLCCKMRGRGRRPPRSCLAPSRSEKDDFCHKV